MDSLCQAPHAEFCRVVCQVVSFSYTTLAGNCLVFRRVGSLFDTPLAVIILVVRRSVWAYVGWVVYLTRTVLASVLSFGEWGVYYMPLAAICLFYTRFVRFS